MSNPYYNENELDDLFNDSSSTSYEEIPTDYTQADPTDPNYGIRVTGGGVIGGETSPLMIQTVIGPLGAALNVLVLGCFSRPFGRLDSHPTSLTMHTIMNRATGGEYGKLERYFKSIEWLAHYHQGLRLINYRLEEVRLIQSFFVKFLDIDDTEIQRLLNGMNEAGFSQEVKHISDVMNEKDMINHYLRYSTRVITGVEDVLEGFSFTANSIVAEYVGICETLGIKPDEMLIDEGIIINNELGEINLINTSKHMNNLLQKVQQTRSAI